MVVFKGITLTGFWPAKTLGGVTAEAKLQLYSKLESLIASATISTPVEATYHLGQLEEAFRHAYVVVAVVKFSLPPMVELKF